MINQILKDSMCGSIDVQNTEASLAWAIVKDAVDYPVKIVPAFYKVYEDREEYRNASGATLGGNDKEFHLVLVDMYREGDQGFKCVSTVTEKYGTVRTADIYEDLRQQLQEIDQKHVIRRLYVAQNGGSQTLYVQMAGMRSLKTPDELVMELRLRTSVDGTMSHSISMSAHDKVGNTSMYVYGGDYNLSARHTTTVGERTVNFIPQITKMIENWNTVIIPAFELMGNSKFDRKTALEFLEQLAEDSGMGEQHRAKVAALYCGPALHTKDTSDSAYRVNYALNQYIDSDMNERPELQNRLKAAIAKRIAAYVKTKKLA